MKSDKTKLVEKQYFKVKKKAYFSYSTDPRVFYEVFSLGTCWNMGNFGGYIGPRDFLSSSSEV